MSDDVAAWVRLAVRGNQDARTVLALRASTSALRTAAAAIGSRDLAFDIAQDVAVDVISGLAKLKDPERFDAWVYRISTRRTLRAMRRGWSTRAMERPLVDLADASHPTSPDHAAASSEQLAARRAIREALAAIPPRQRLALALRYVHDLSDADTAAALGCRLGTAQSLLSRGRAALRDQPALADFGQVASPEEGIYELRS
jgi:RNA polymerase sigma factor (sigma-70 family)